MLKVMHVVGARPNFPKAAPIMAEMAKYPDQFSQLLVHTGQHYDNNMSRVFFENLDIPAPDEYLNCGGGSHAQQTAKIMSAFEPVVLKHRPQCLMVVGDVNSTVACALVCSKLGITVAHVEAGLRSRDRTMPEEINRLVTDQLSDLLFTPSEDGDANLIAEGIDPLKIHCVGNVMIDTLVKMLPRARERTILNDIGIISRQYMLVTLHRPSNVDDPTALAEIIRAVARLSEELPIVFPVHPRTRPRIAETNIALPSTVHLLDPLGYLDFLALMQSARLVITDSGGVQEETTYLQIPCLTTRPNTERPITISCGSNQLVDSRFEALVGAAIQILRGNIMSSRIPALWDGRAAERIVRVMASIGSE